jgi:hypothetical protein
MPLPNVLIIGAMKAGTTSLYMDLATHDRGFLGHDKEPCALCSDAVLTPAGRAAYEAIYAKARPDQIRVDASTGYAKRPDFDGVVPRALEVLPAGFKVIYLVRHPIDRIISQHHHEHAEGRVGPSIDEEVRRHPRYVQYSRYSYQISPWLDAIGPSRVLVIRFEDYVNRRRETMERVLEYLGLPPFGDTTDQGKVYNKSEGKPVKTKFWHALQHNPVYRKYLRPMAPLELRLAVRRLLLPAAKVQLAPPSLETVDYIRRELAEDVRQLGGMTGLTKPVWDDFDAEREAPAAPSTRGG